MYPWDQDKTWGYHDGIRGYEVFYDMPLTFGMAGDRPPGWPKNLPAPGFFGFGNIWWRPGGHFSAPLLANPQFRKLFLARTKEIVDTVYTEDIFFPMIEKMGERLKEDVQIRAEIMGQDPKRAAEHLRRNLDSLRDHLTKRRKYLLDQNDLKKAGKFDRTELTSWRRTFHQTFDKVCAGTATVQPSVGPVVEVQGAPIHHKCALVRSRICPCEMAGDEKHLSSTEFCPINSNFGPALRT
jgi:hypothetical protein